MRSGLAAAVAVAIAFSLICACGAFGSSPDDGAPRPDVGAPETASGDDADAASDDAADGPASDRIEVDGGRFCADHPAPALCEDFDGVGEGDGGRAAPAGWTVYNVTATTSVTFDAPGSSQYGVRFFAPAAATNSDVERIAHSVGAGATFSRLTCSFDVFFDAFPTVNSGNGFLIFFADIGGGEVRLDTERLWTDATSSGGNPSIAKGVWARYTVDIDLGAGAQHATLAAAGGATIATVALTGFSSLATNATVSFGNRFKPSGDVIFRMDNILCDTK
jgi:hypothetical protein